jgi:hypothetical protein
MLENRESTETREQNGETRANDAEIRAKTVHSCKPCSRAVLTAEGVRELFNYSPESGLLTLGSFATPEAAHAAYASAAPKYHGKFVRLA